ncbi:undecaprenyl-diphosphate phosphatase [Neobacillus terrae]|uniref:undecaprenyl-diphosphate phosphatase n=1 Tax=Neobacillus terrae TaxID=3034837 RepID=UPI00140E0C62|nr:undecaprenyl-diphosphate phosphatase [Neobacillus terrae]NHM32275.1 undecaprenyl-diphosphate phosphatase [Neobacillus terrae]
MSEHIIAIIMGIVEGLTEFLPVSSTGHLILTGELLNFTSEKAKTFEIVIQLGSICAVIVLYFKRLLSLFTFKKNGLNLLHIIVAMIPAVILGLLFHDFIKDVLFSYKTVAITLVLGGILMIYAEKKKHPVTSENLDQITYKQAFGIGLFQCLALFPGFSRSGATIAGGILLGTNHKTAAEFSFLVAVPMMIAASGLDLIKSADTLSANDTGLFLTGFITAFIVAMMAIVFFLKLLAKVKLTPFAIYRFVLAIAVWALLF